MRGWWCILLTVGAIACAPQPAPPVDRAAAPVVVSNGVFEWLVAGYTAHPVQRLAWTARLSDVDAERLQTARLTVLGGAGYEPWGAVVHLSFNRTIRVAEAVRDRWLAAEGAVPHSHGPGASSQRGPVVGEVWLDPTNLRPMAAAVVAGLTRHGVEVGSGAALEAQIGRLEQAIAGVPRGGVFLTARAGYAYLARRLGARTLAFDLRPDEMPPQHLIDEMRASAANTGARLLLWPQPPAALVADGLRRAAGLTSVVVPLGDADPAWPKRYEAALRTLAERRLR